MDTQKTGGGDTLGTSIGQTCSNILGKKSSMVDWEQGCGLKTQPGSFSIASNVHHHPLLHRFPQELQTMQPQLTHRETGLWVGYTCLMSCNSRKTFLDKGWGDCWTFSAW